MPHYGNMLKVAFSEAEMELLSAFPEFVKAAAAISSMNDFEEVCRMGGKLLVDKEQRERLRRIFPKSDRPPGKD
jgi:hypothetical protein